MEDDILKCNIKSQKVKARSPSKKDFDQDFKIKNVVIGNSEVRRNPKRQVGVKNYEEIDEPQDDRYVYCDFCETVFVDNCTKCGQLAILRDVEVEMGTENRAKMTVPKNSLVILPSPIHGLGVFARVPLKKGIKMGPYEGKITRMESSTGYSWKLRDGRLVDAADEKYSNWMRYINCARHFNEQNVVAFQYKGNLFYRTCRDIKIGEELLVYYGQSFAKILGIDIRNYFRPKEEQMIEHPKICQHCNYGYKDLSKLKEHIALCKWNPENIKKIAEKVFSCRFCPLDIADEEYCKKHEKNCEKRQKRKEQNGYRGDMDEERNKTQGTKKNCMKYQCQNCEYSSHYKSHFKEHQQIHTKIFPFSCRVCKKGFNTENSLKCHMFKHLNEATNLTIIQTKKVLNGNATRSTILMEICQKKFDILKYECEKCDFATATIGHIKDHINIHTKKVKLVCVICEFHCDELKDISFHVNQSHGIECIFCERGLFCEIHMKKMFEYSESHICGICGYIASLKGNLKMHIANVHLQEKKYNCQFCNFSNNNKVNLKNHINGKHLELKIYKCDSCDYSANYKGTLRRHIHEVHLKTKNYKCGSCDYSSYRKKGLKRHINAVHLALKIYKCDSCDYSANDKGTLRRHIHEVHLKTKNYKCGSCDYSSYRKGDLKRHINAVHLKLKNNKCGSCDYSSYRKGDLKRHINAVHLKLKNDKCDSCDY